MSNYTEDKDLQKKKELEIGDSGAVDTALSIASENGTTNTTVNTNTSPVSSPEFKHEPYKPSDAVTQAEAMLKQHLAHKPGAYTSAWQTQLNDTLNKILNREPFSYDLNGDMLYQQYKDQYKTQGQMAMMDTMGQAQAMTGGYGNSYAQSVGQQAYQGYLQQLNDRVPELYQLALDQYNRKGDELYNQYGMYADREALDYGRYRDQVGDYYTELDRLANDARYQGEQDYGRWADKLNLDYGMYRDQVADKQWQAEFDEAKRRYDQEWELANGKTTSSSPSGNPKPGDNNGDDSGWDNGGIGTKAIELLQQHLGVTVDGKWGPASRAAAMKKYGISDPQELYRKLHAVNQQNAFTGTTYSEAVAFMKSKGVSGSAASNAMTESEFKRSAEMRAEFTSYQEYLKKYVEYCIKKK